MVHHEPVPTQRSNLLGDPGSDRGGNEPIPGLLSQSSTPNPFVLVGIWNMFTRFILARGLMWQQDLLAEEAEESSTVRCAPLSKQPLFCLEAAGRLGAHVGALG